MRILILLLLFLFQHLGAQSKDADKIIENLVSKYNSIQDYVVDVTISVDVEFLKVPDSQAKIYFEQPDKVHMESDGFAMLPKHGLEFSPNSLLKNDYTALYEKDVLLNETKCSIVKIIPSGSESEVILTTLWIDQKKDRIVKIESTTKTNGTFTIDFSYDNNQQFPLPSKIIFAFNLDKMNIPSAITGEPDNEKSDLKKKNTDSRTRGKVSVNYTNYRINKGIDDAIFQKKN